eukprot:31333-Pelagococcus_subviridis.AAC.19
MKRRQKRRQNLLPFVRGVHEARLVVWNVGVTRLISIVTSIETPPCSSRSPPRSFAREAARPRSRARGTPAPGPAGTSRGTPSRAQPPSGCSTSAARVGSTSRRP